MLLIFNSKNENDLDPEMTSRQKREANLGVVLISISILFILCQSVKIIPDIYEVGWCRLSNKQTCPTTKLMEILINISHLLLAINSSANFIIYTWRGKSNDLALNKMELEYSLCKSVECLFSLFKRRCLQLFVYEKKWNTHSTS